MLKGNMCFCNAGQGSDAQVDSQENSSWGIPGQWEAQAEGYPGYSSTAMSSQRETADRHTLQSAHLDTMVILFFLTSII